MLRSISSFPVSAGMTALGNWGATIGLLMVQDVDRKFKTSRLGAILSLLEPILLVIAILVTRTILLERIPRYGQSPAVWYSSGIFPFYLFIRLSARGRGTPYRAVQRFPRVTGTDYVIASTITETALFLTTMVAWFTGMWLWGLEEAVPKSIIDCIIPLSLFMALGIGFGLVNSAISTRFQMWNFIYGFIGRGLMFASGVFWVADLMPYVVRSYAIWNPLDHGIVWFRLGLYGRYPHFTLDRDYLIGYAGIVLFLGIIAYVSTLRVSKE